MTPTQVKRHVKEKEVPFVMEGTVEEALPGAAFSVRLATGHSALA